MRYSTDKLKNQLGNTRVIEKFLWFPKIINGELRWLEKVKILQKVLQVDVGGNMEWGCYKHKWRDIEWEEF